MADTQEYSALSTQARPALTAHYQSPSSQPFSATFELDKPAPTAAARKQYLARLRESTVALQGQINDELTQRMAEDKMREVGAATGGNLAGVDDVKEEENYGEEVVDDEN